MVATTREDRTMEASELDVLGPVDYLVVEFPADKANFSGEMAAELRSLIDRELVRVLDLVILRKEPDGSVEVAELADVEKRNVGAGGAGSRSGAAIGRGGRRGDRHGPGARQHRGRARLREPLGRTARLVDPPVGRPARGQRPHSDPGAAGRDRSGRPTARSLTCRWPEDAEVAGA